MAMSLCFLLLVFVLGLGLILLFLVQDDFRYRQFLIKYYDVNLRGRNDRYCESMMVRRYLIIFCKDINIFIYGSKSSIKVICGNKNGNFYGEILRISKIRFQVIICKYVGGFFRFLCRYRVILGFRSIVIVCENGLFVYFDEFFFRL